MCSANEKWEAFFLGEFVHVYGAAADMAHGMAPHLPFVFALRTKTGPAEGHAQWCAVVVFARVDMRSGA